MLLEEINQMLQQFKIFLCKNGGHILFVREIKENVI